MKLIIPSHALKKALSFVGQAILPNPIVPVMENVRMQVTGGVVEFTGSDLHTTICCNSTAESSENGMALIPYKRLSDLLAVTPEGPVTLNINTEKPFSHKVSTTAGNYTVSGENPKDYEIEKPSSKVLEFTILPEHTESFFKALSATVPFCPVSHYNPAINGLLWRFDDTLSFAATDNHRIATAPTTVEVPGGIRKLTTPTSFARKLLGLQKDILPSDSITVEVFERRITITVADRIISTVLINDPFPAYEPYLNTEGFLRVTVDREQFASSLKRIQCFADLKEQVAKVTISRGQLLLTASDSAYGVDAAESIAVDYEGEPVEIGFNAKYMLGLVSNMQGAEVEFYFDSFNKPMFLMDTAFPSTALLFAYVIKEPVPA